VFQELLKKYLISNNHRILVEMIPDFELEAKQSQEELSSFASIKSSFTEEQLQEIIQKTKILKEAQEKPDSPEARATLPKLGLEDIDRKTKEIPISIIQEESNKENNDFTLLTHPLSSNGILYTDIVFNYSLVDLEDLELMPLFTRLLMEAGTTNYDPVTLSRKIGTHTGGISIGLYNDYYHSHHIPGTVANLDEAIFYLTIRGKATKDKIPILFDLFSEILLNSHLNNQKRAIELLKEAKASKESSILTSGHRYGSTRLASRDSILGYFNEITGGLTSVRNAGKLLKEAETNWENMLNRLEKIKLKLLFKGKPSQDIKNSKQLVINLTGDETLLSSSRSVIDSFVEKIPASPFTSSSSSFSHPSSLSNRWKDKKASLLLPKKNEGFAIPSLVNYVVYGGRIYNEGEKVSGSNSVFIRYLSNGFLWDQIRVLGGAYGGFAQFSEISGRMTFLSYRDPNLLNTLKIYKKSISALSPSSTASSSSESESGTQEMTSQQTHEGPTSEDILQNIIGSVGDLDSPQSVDQKGYTSLLQYLTEESPEFRQQYRNEVLSSKIEDIPAFITKMEKLKETGSVIVFGSQSALETANKELSNDEKLIIEPALQNMNNNANEVNNGQEGV
jgi:Zn-dependent M16 (insulinase) family peptidase